MYVQYYCVYVCAVKCRCNGHYLHSVDSRTLLLYIASVCCIPAFLVRHFSLVSFVDDKNAHFNCIMTTDLSFYLQRKHSVYYHIIEKIQKCSTIIFIALTLCRVTNIFANGNHFQPINGQLICS